MKTLYLIALVGFALAVGWAIPFNGDRTEALDRNTMDQLKGIANYFPAQDTASHAGLGDKLDEDGNEDEESDDDEEDDDDDGDEDEAEQNEDENGENLPENAVQEYGDDEDNDEVSEADVNRIALSSSSVQKSSDPIIGLFARGIIRGVGRVIRRRRRRRRRGGRRGGRRRWRGRRRRWRG